MAPRRVRKLPEVDDVFDMLTVVSPPVRGKWGYLVECRCSCGVVKPYLFGNLYSGNSTNCGCRRAEIARKGHLVHGDHSRSATKRLYNIWQGMNKRCNNNHGGYGIYDVYSEWQHDYVAFRDWALSNGYNDSLTIDRIDNEKGYEPSNCRWATHQTQNRNRRNCIHLTAFGETKLLVEWAEDSRCLVSRNTLYQRLKSQGWEAERAIATPARK